jgi:biopolymer transport protein ExbD
MRHRHRNAHGSATKPELPITPMLDMSFQLLAFFLIIYKPATLEGQLSLMLPKSGTETSTALNINELDDTTSEELSIRVVTDGNGLVTSLDLLSKTNPLPKSFPDGDKLLVELKAIAEKKRAESSAIPKLDYQFAEDVNFQYVIKQLDEAKQAGFETVTPTILRDLPKPKTPDTPQQPGLDIDPN